ncbi:hypothetical protein CO608_09160 [Lysobacteraceae bacterium NML08-0793]|nr:hypothetical protein CO608_09160 [Xanthomonadaceae bacterium NML08-0793]
MKKTLRIDPGHPCLPGHFPGQPVVPGVLLLDAVQAMLEEELGEIAALRFVQVKFLRPLLPGQVAQLTLSTLDKGGWRFHIQHGEAVIASGEVVAA